MLSAPLRLSPLAVALWLAASPSHAVELEPQVITANPLGNRQLAAPSTVLEGDNLLQQQHGSLGETLNKQPGVASTWFGPGASRPVIRGLDGDRIRILRNGVGALDASSLSYDHAVPLDPVTVDRVEIVRGPAALLYGGNAIGGMSGRLITGVLIDFVSWHTAMLTIGGLALGAALVFWKVLPESRNFRPQTMSPRSLLDGFVMHFNDAGLPWLFLEAFLLMGAFVTLFNYIGYRLLAEPYHMNQALVGLLSVVYLSGIYSSAQVGALADKLGRRKVFWASIVVMACGLLMTLASPLAMVIVGMLVFTFGFFGAHSVASSWIGRRALKAKGQASSLYLFSYYAGSSVAGTAGGVFWHQWGWNGIGLFIGSLLAVALLVALHLSKLPPKSG